MGCDRMQSYAATSRRQSFDLLSFCFGCHAAVQLYLVLDAIASGPVAVRSFSVC